MKKVVIFSPSRFSLYTICVAELLHRRDIVISGIVIKRLVSPKRFFSEFSRDGNRLLKKIWKKLILRKSGYAQRNYETILDLMNRDQIRWKNVEELSKNHAIPVLYCSDLNDSAVMDLLKSTVPDLVVFTGGGLIRKHILNLCGAGILNCHMGVLPRYRGMDVVEWPILEGKQDQVGMTLHFMDEGVDTGDILAIHKVAIKPNETIAQLRERFEPIMCEMMVNTCCDYLNDQIRRQPQEPSAGKQYFIMHPALIALAAQRMDPKMSQISR
jgi:folate-dependent phosphoribosylglycinamide formyltransferase PurN